MIKKMIMLFISAIGLVGCASTYDPKTLSKPTDSTSFELTEEVTSVVHRGLLNIRWEYIVKNGAYVPEYENNDGVFYQGPIDTFSRKFGEDSRDYGPEDGGLWVSKCNNPKYGNQRAVLPYAYQDHPHRNRELAYAAAKKSDTAGSAQDLIPYMNNSSVAAGVGNAIGLGVVDLIIAAGRGDLVIIDGMFAPDALDKISDMVLPQVAPCSQQALTAE